MGFFLVWLPIAILIVLIKLLAVIISWLFKDTRRHTTWEEEDWRTNKKLTDPEEIDKFVRRYL